MILVLRRTTWGRKFSVIVVEKFIQVSALSIVSSTVQPLGLKCFAFFPRFLFIMWTPRRQEKLFSWNIIRRGNLAFVTPSRTFSTPCVEFRVAFWSFLWRARRENIFAYFLCLHLWWPRRGAWTRASCTENFQGRHLFTEELFRQPETSCSYKAEEFPAHWNIWRKKLFLI